MTRTSIVVIMILIAGVLILLSTKLSYAEPMEARTSNNSNKKAPKMSPLERFDTNGDGKISYEEAPLPMQENFEKHDLDQNGFIEDAELDTLPKHPPRHKGDNNK